MAEGWYNGSRQTDREMVHWKQAGRQRDGTMAADRLAEGWQTGSRQTGSGMVNWQQKDWQRDGKLAAEVEHYLAGWQGEE